jgi:hypothetical protein
MQPSSTLPYTLEPPPETLPALQRSLKAQAHRLYAAKLKEHTDHTVVVEELKKQLLAAVPDTYLAILANDEMGYADVSSISILAHLQTTYGIVTASEDLEANRNTLSDPWNLDWPQEDLWTRINTAQTFAAANHDPITDAAAISLTLAVFEKAAMYHDQTVAWRNRDNTGATIASFREYFTRAAKEHRRNSTAQTAGYHGAHAATTTTSPPPDVTSNKFCHLVYYCSSSHGFSRNPAHTSPTCRYKQTGHNDDDDGTNARVAARRPAPSPQLTQREAYGGI